MGIIAPTAPTGTAGGSLTGTYPNPGLAENSVGTTQIAPSAVHTEEIQAKAVTSPKLAETLEIVKGLGMFAKAPPAAQPAAVPVPAFVTGASGLSTEAKVKELVEAVEKIVKLLKEYGLTA